MLCLPGCDQENCLKRGAKGGGGERKIKLKEQIPDQPYINSSANIFSPKFNHIKIRKCPMCGKFWTEGNKLGEKV